MAAASGWFEQGVSESIVEDDKMGREEFEFNSVIPNAVSAGTPYTAESILESKGEVWIEAPGIIRPQVNDSLHDSVTEDAVAPSLYVRHKFNKHYTSRMKYTATEMRNAQRMSRRMQRQFKGMVAEIDADGIQTIGDNAGRVELLPKKGTATDKMSFDFLSKCVSMFHESGYQGPYTCLLCERHMRELTGELIKLNDPETVRKGWKGDVKAYQGEVSSAKLYRMNGVYKTTAAPSGTLNCTIQLGSSNRVIPKSTDGSNNNVDWRFQASGLVTAASTSAVNPTQGSFITVANLNRVHRSKKQDVGQLYQMRIAKGIGGATVSNWVLTPPPFQIFTGTSGDTVDDESFHWANCTWTSSTAAATETAVKIETVDEVASILFCDESVRFMQLIQPGMPEGVRLAAAESTTNNGMSFSQTMDWDFSTRSVKKRIDCAANVSVLDPLGVMLLAAPIAYT